MQKTPNERLNGLVLIAVLGLTALIALFMTINLSTTQVSSQRLSHILETQQLRYNAYSTINLAREILTRDLNKNTYDGVGDNWYHYRNWTDFTMEDGSILSLKVRDATGLYNLNSLVGLHSGELIRFRNFLRYHGLNPNLAGAIADWVDSDSRTNTFGGKESNYYKLQTPSLKSPNSKISTAAELQGIWNLSKEDLDKLADITVSLPNHRFINVNNLEEMYFRSLFPDGSIGAHLRQSRSKKYETVNKFLDTIGTKKTPNDLNLSLLSPYFLLQLKVKSGTMEVRANALLERTNNQTIIRSLWWH